MLKIDDELNDYIIKHTAAEDPVLAALNRQTWLDIPQPRMLSGHLQGKILEMISYMVRPQYILEIGTFTGYSAICLAKGLQNDGKLITIEKNDELEDIATKFIQKAGLSDKIKIIIGDALQVVQEINLTFDLVFIDGDKKEYINYYHSILPKVNPGGFILIDNVLWDGKVIDPSQHDDPDTRTIMELNEIILKDPKVDNAILPLRDGINIIRKR